MVSEIAHYFVLINVLNLQINWLRFEIKMKGLN